MGADRTRALEVFDHIRSHWRLEAVRLCREWSAADPEAPLPHALMALATWSQPNRAARCCWAAVQRRAQGSAVDRGIVDALQAYWSVSQQPELVDERFRDPPPLVKAELLGADLQQVSQRNVGNMSAGDRALLAELVEWAAAHGGATWPGPEPTVAELKELFEHYNAYLAETGAMPYEVSGYRRVLQVLLAKELDPAASSLRPRLPSGDGDPRMDRIPRHPEEWPAISGRLPGMNRAGLAQWEPQKARPFELQAGIGGRRSFLPGSGKPALIVFFLGFGCAHCVAQLKDLDPKAGAFRDAGVDVLSIGTDSYQEVLAAQQASIENGVDPLHFDVLCDPDGRVFRDWGVWDGIAGEALHGTFLVDGEGRVLWRDVSERPFEQSEWLLAECQRLLAVWR